MLDIAKQFFEERGYRKFTCCICGCEFYDLSGNDPAPLVNDPGAVCCNSCDFNFVLPARAARCTK